MSDDLKGLIQELPDALTIPKAPSGPEIIQQGLARRLRNRLLRLAATVAMVGLVAFTLLHSSWKPLADHKSISHVDFGGRSAGSLGLASPDASRRGWTVHSEPAKAYEVETPPGWQVSWFGTRYMAVGNYEFGSGDFCGRRGALTTMPADGSFFLTYETTSSSGFDFTPRPSSFALDAGTLATYEGTGCRQMYRFTFTDSGRYFVVYMGFGPRAGASVRGTALQVLDSFRLAS